jgi:hypothetical protein
MTIFGIGSLLSGASKVRHGDICPAHSDRDGVVDRLAHRRSRDSRHRGWWHRQLSLGDHIGNSGRPTPCQMVASSECDVELLCYRWPATRRTVQQ